MPQVRATTPEADCRAAARRVGSNPQQQARWLLDLCHIDVPRLAPDERWRLRQQWGYLLGLGVVSTLPRGSDLPTQRPLSRQLDQRTAKASFLLLRRRSRVVTTRSTSIGSATGAGWQRVWQSVLVCWRSVVPAVSMDS